MLYQIKIGLFILFAIILYLIFFALGATEDKEENFFKNVRKPKKKTETYLCVCVCVMSPLNKFSGMKAVFGHSQSGNIHFGHQLVRE